MKYLYIWLCLFLSGKVVAQDSPIALTQFTDAVVETQNKELLKNGLLTASVQQVQDGATLMSHNASLSVPSASTLKLVATATALSVLGADFRYSTFLEYEGEIKRGVLKGNLYIRGTGDPTLGSDRFKDTHLTASQLLDRWVAIVKQQGIKKIDGAVIADASWFDEQTLAESWPWGDLGNYYGAGVSGLNFADNQYIIQFTGGKAIGDRATYEKTIPSIPYLQFDNKVSTAPRGTGDQVNVMGHPFSTQVYLVGTVPVGSKAFAVKAALPKGDFYAAYALTEALKKADVEVENEPAVTYENATMPRVIIDTYKSPVLKEIARETNWYSINVYADALLKSSAKQLANVTEFTASVEAVKAYWEAKGVDMRGFFAKDGSGLSPSGSLTAFNLCGILNAMTRDPHFQAFYEGIAVAGKHGTVRNIGKGTRAEGLMRVKSGSIDGTRAYAGYIQSKSGKLLSFSVSAQKYVPGTGREAGLELNRLLGLLADL